MMVYCKDRSTKLPRKRGRYIKRKPPVSNNINRGTGYLLTGAKERRYVPDDANIPSQFEMRCATGEWETNDDYEARVILEGIING